MSFFEAILLGIIQGITEFFPISSSGHLVIAEQLFGLETEYGVLFNVVLHIGTLIAIFMSFRRDVFRLFYSYVGMIRDIGKNFRIFLKNLFKNQDNAYRKIIHTQYRKLAVMVLVTSIPTAIIGLFLRNFVTGSANSLFVVGFGLLNTGLLLFVTVFHQNGSKSSKDVSVINALILGVCQGCSVIPGISRFGTTLMAGLVSGYKKKFALKYSFLMSIPAIIGAAILELMRIPDGVGITFGFAVCCIIGAIIAAISGIFAIKALIWIVKKHKLSYFSYYCFVLGILVIVLNYLV